MDMCASASVYVHTYSTSPLEATNSQIHQLAPKAVHFAHSYIARADAALLGEVLGHEVRQVSPRAGAAPGARLLTSARARLVDRGTAHAPPPLPQEFLHRLGVTGDVALAWARRCDAERTANAARKASHDYLKARVDAKAARNKQKAAFRAAQAQHTYVRDDDEDDGVAGDEEAPAPSVRKRVPVAPAEAPAPAAAALACAFCSKPYTRRGFLERHEATCRGPVPAKRRRREAAEDAAEDASSGTAASPIEEAATAGPTRAPSTRRRSVRAMVEPEEEDDDSDADTSEAESESSESDGSVAEEIIVLDDDYVDSA